ncbi:protease HtpX [Rhabdochromatium marinum]|uniref:protease HtpX n=1 Tax=Rhabdochromatium marinum TaxID=48729 RepID=UPI0019063E74|nr:protease HtpX [Rhabdochromatium marinum]MBK1649378.1 zinc metalloprotease HtpX [Rhabdochromatium marinum]
MLRILLFLGTNLAILVVLSLVFSLFGLGQTPADPGGLQLGPLLVMAAVVGFTGSLISLGLSKWMAKRSMGVRIIEQPGTAFERWLVELVRQQSKRAGIGMPDVGIFDQSAPNAFATGWNRNHALVAVSTGLLEQMSQNEVEAVVGHEISHVANGDMVTMALMQGVVNTFVVFLSRVIGSFVDRVILKNESGRGLGYFLVSMVAEICLSVLATMIVMWFSRYREFRADAGGARLSSRENMIGALRALQRVHEPQDLPAGELAAFGISGKIADGFKAAFASHPPLERRIAALEQARG